MNNTTNPFKENWRRQILYREVGRLLDDSEFLRQERPNQYYYEMLDRFQLEDFHEKIREEFTRTVQNCKMVHESMAPFQDTPKFEKQTSDLDSALEECKTRLQLLNAWMVIGPVAFTRWNQFSKVFRRTYWGEKK